MTDKIPVFRVVKDADPSLLKDLPHLELIPNSASPETGTANYHTASKQRPGPSLDEKSPDLAGTAQVQAENGNPTVVGQYMLERPFVGYPPLPALVIGLFLLVFMLLGD